MSRNADDLFRDRFIKLTTEFTDKFLSNSDAHELIYYLLGFLVIVLAFIEISRFMLDGFDLEAVTTAVLTTFVTLMFLKGFPVAFDVAYETADNLGLLILKIGTGNSDSFYLSKWVSKSLSYIYGGDYSLWDVTVKDIVMTLLWHVVAFILQCAMFVVASWSTWTLALAKIIGPIFIPLLLLPATRPLFDGWLKFTVGSLLLLFVLRGAGVLAALGIRAQFEAMGIIACGGNIDFSQCTNSIRDSYAVSYTDDWGMLTNMVIAAALIVSSIGITAAIASNIASPSSAVSKGVSKTAGKLIKFAGK